jgi:hypothetical protein
VPGRPTGLPAITPAPRDFGTRTTLARAEAVAGFSAEVPKALGRPAAAWVDRTPAEEGPGAARIVMAWASRTNLPALDDTRWGAILFEFQGLAEVASKHIYAETGDIAQATVDGAGGYWLTGVHTLDLLTDDGIRTFTVTDNVLVWQKGDRTYRLETGLARVAAIRLASSIA